MKKLLAGILMMGMAAAAALAEEAPYRHVVMFKFKEDATPAQIEKVEKAFGALKGKIEGIQDYEWGTNVSPEGKSDGFTHCFFVTFKNKQDLEKYLPHPAHQEFVAGLKGLIDKVLVFDYVAKAG